MQLIHHNRHTDTDTRTSEEPVADYRRDTVRERRWEVAPGQLVSLVAGVGFIIVGVIALARAGIDTPLSTPVVTVLGFTHTAWLGIVEIGAGLLLMLAGLDPFARAASAVLGALLVIGGVLMHAIPEDLPKQLALDPDMATPLIVVGAIVAVAALVLPAWRTQSVERQVDVP